MSEAGADWFARQARLAAMADRQIFFVGGAPRSGTTWVQQMLDAHPQVSCRGEGLFQQELAKPLDQILQVRRKALAAKNAMLRHSGGYLPPSEADGDFLFGSAVLLALQQQCVAKPCRAVGEKTPENVFLFPRLKRLFPAAKFIGIARDPRDSLSSAWHFWAKPRLERGGDEAIAGFVEASLPAVEEGLKRLLDYVEQYPEDVRVFSYESLLRMPEAILAGLFRLLDVADDAAVAGSCVESAAFVRQTGGRKAGEVQEGAFLRKGVAGDWVSTLPPSVGSRIADRLGWAFQAFGWQR